MREGKPDTPGSSDDNVPVCKGHLRASLRKIETSSPRHKDFLPYRRYATADREWLEPHKKYDLLVELWPTSVTVDRGGKLILEVSPKDEQGSGKFTHVGPTVLAMGLTYRIILLTAMRRHTVA